MWNSTYTFMNTNGSPIERCLTDQDSLENKGGKKLLIVYLRKYASAPAYDKDV